MFGLKILREGIRPPEKAHSGDAGFDIFAPENIHVSPGMVKKIPLGFALEVPFGYVCMIQEKSGLAARHGLVTIGNVIDSTYRGECHVILHHIGGEIFTIKTGEKLAQMLIIPVYCETQYNIIDGELSKTSRGEGGFGSTGR